MSTRYTTGPIPFTFGVPIPVQASLSLILGVNYGAVITTPGDLFDSQGFIDFSNTASLSAIEVLDAQGSAVPGFTVSSESGAVYPVPEPSTLALLGASALLSYALRQRAGALSPARSATRD